MVERDINEQLDEFVEYIKNAVNCQCPAEIVTVNSDGTVDILVKRNDELEDQKIPRVKIKHIETQKAFVFLGVSSGDYGVVRYFDRNISDYVRGDDGYNYDDRSHNTNDACFELGFVPNPSAYSFPTGHDLVLGTKDGKCLITIDTGGNIVIEGATSIKLGSGATNKVLTEGSVITDSLGAPCTITSNTTKTYAE